MVSSDDLRAAMRRFPAGLAVVTLDAGGQRVGVTVGSLVSLSLEPPLVGMSVGRTAPLHEHVRDARSFALNLLGRGQEALAQHFGRSGLPPLVAWRDVETRRGSTGVPLLADAAAWLECRLRAEHEAGDHTFFVADVLAAELGRVPPGLVYLDGRYRDV